MTAPDPNVVAAPRGARGWTVPVALLDGCIVGCAVYSYILLGKPVEVKPEESDIKQVEVLPGANFLGVGQNNLSSAVNEEFNKMNNDPLVMMRMEEQKALQRSPHLTLLNEEWYVSEMKPVMARMTMLVETAAMLPWPICFLVRSSDDFFFM